MEKAVLFLGTQIQARTSSGNMIIVISLLFALVIYNSYSATITSMLSVKLTKIRTIADLLNSDYDIGYAKNSVDETFLRVKPPLKSTFYK